MIEIDFEKKLEITINNEIPVILTDLTLSLLAVTQQYQKFIESEAGEDYKVGSELYIKEVRKGSIVIELVAQTMPILPLLWSGGSFNEWVEQAKNITQWLLGKTESPPKELSKQDLKQWHSIMEPVAKDSGSQMNFTVCDKGQVINNFFIGSQEANAAQNRITKEIELLEEPKDRVLRRKVMYWNQTRFGENQNTGDKAIIDDVSRKALKVMFENNAVKDAMLKGDPKFDRPWQELAFVVDVEVQTVNEIPKLYKVLKYYPEHTFDPND